MFLRYLRGAGFSLLIATLLFFLMIKFNNDYIKIQLLFVALYNYAFCLLGLVVFYILEKISVSSNVLIGVTCFLLLGVLSSISLPPAYPIFITGSLSFYLIQLLQNKKISWVLVLSGPLLLAIILLVI
ncbi:hypothetical protein D3C76_683610 [compost metagenome]